MYVVNPETDRPIKIGSRVYQSLVRRGVLCPDDMAPPKLTRSKKYEEKEEKALYKEDKEEIKHLDDDEELMERVAQCAADSMKVGNFDGLNADEVKNRLEQMIIKALSTSSSSS